MSAIESVLHERRQFAPPAAVEKAAAISGMAAYRALAEEAERDYEGFWARLARETLEWRKPFGKALDETNAPFYKWFDDGELNARPCRRSGGWPRPNPSRPARRPARS